MSRIAVCEPTVLPRSAPEIARESLPAKFRFPDHETETVRGVRLIAKHGADAKLPDLLVTLADCPKARLVSIHDRCRARYERYCGW